MLGKEAVLDRLPEIYTRFILAIDPPCRTWASRNACTRLRNQRGNQRLSRQARRYSRGQTM